MFDWHVLDKDKTDLPAIGEVVAIELPKLPPTNCIRMMFGVRVSTECGWYWERVYDSPMWYQEQWSTEDSEDLEDEEPLRWHALPKP